MRKYEELTREELQKIVSESTSISEVLRKLNLVDRGDNHTTFKKFLVDNGYDMSTLVGRAIYRGAEHPIPRTLQEMLVENGTRDSNKLKLKLIRYGIKKEMCENPLCEIPHREENMWAGEPVTLELHHINGIHTDNRLENLILLCPLCHSQTKNFRGKNSKATEESQRLKLLKQAASECAEKAIPIIIQNAIDKQNGISYQRKFGKKPVQKDYGNCIVCGKPLKRKQTKYCCEEHAKLAQSRNVPTKDELLEASYQVKSLAELNRFLNKGVTDNAVKKWCEKYEIYAQVKENFKTKRYPVIQCDMQGNEIKTWKDAYEAAQELGVTRTSIQSACSGIKGSCGGYKWKYKI